MLGALQVRFFPARGKGSTTREVSRECRGSWGSHTLREVLDLTESKGPQEEVGPDGDPLGLFMAPVASSPFSSKEGDQRETKMLQSVTFGLETWHSHLNYRLTFT